MTLSIELLPAPLGPIMARISCSRTSNEISESALTPPKASEILRKSRMTSPVARTLGCLLRRLRGETAHVANRQLRAYHAAAPVFELDLGLDELCGAPAVQCVDQHAVFF